MSTLEERLQGASALPWIPDAAKAEKYGKDCCQVNPLIGIAVDHFARTNFRGDGEYDVVVLNVEGVGDVAVHCQATVLANQMRAARPRPGERVGVSYLGERVGASQTYADYKVAVDRSLGGEFAWVGDEPDPVPAPAPVAPPAQEFPSSQGAPVASQDDDIPF